MSKNKVIKSVSFNITNETDQQRLKHIEGKTFNSYIKGLIDQDMKNQKQKVVHKSEGGGIKIVIGG